MTDPITKEGRAKFIEYARIIHSNPRMMPVGNEMLNKALAYEAALQAAEARIAKLLESERRLKAMMPLFEEARDALPAISESSRRLYNISPTLADRMDDVGIPERWAARAALGETDG